jgi:ureidoacrylate peracid hydrolase
MYTHLYDNKGRKKRTKLMAKTRQLAKPQTTALVLIEYQNDFLSEKGAMHNGVKDVLASSNMLANTLATVEKARAMGATIMFVPIVFADGFGELGPHPYGLLEKVVEAKGFRKGTWGAEIIAALPRHAGDIVVEGKRGFDGFATTNLDFLLRWHGITTIAIAGLLTNCCVESTARTGYDKGYDVVTLTDCTATIGEKEQRAAVENNFWMFSRPLKHLEFLAELESHAVRNSAA